MNDSILTPDKLIKLSREYLDDVMKSRKLRVKKEHYYIYSLSNFIATKEYFLKKKTDHGRVKHIFNIDDNSNVLPMILEFYNSVRIKNKNYKTPSIVDIKNIIEIKPYDDTLADDYYRALYFFCEIRNSLSHAGNYTFEEKHGECIVSIRSIDSTKIEIPIELFDFVAFYVNSYVNSMNEEDVLKNYMIYKQSKDNKKYYSFESRNATDRIIKILAKTKSRIYHMEHSLSKNKGGSCSSNNVLEVLQELRYNYGNNINRILSKIESADIDDDNKLDLLFQLELSLRADARITSNKIEKCVKNIESMLRLDKKSSSLYSHSVILFTNKAEPKNTNAQAIINAINKIQGEIKSIEIKNNTLEEKSIFIKRYKQVIERILDELPDLMRINEHKYRNAVFHNNIKIVDGKILFWNQKDNVNSDDVHTFEIEKTPEMYDLELKGIEEYNVNVGEITIEELFNILCQYCDLDVVYELIGKLWSINQIDNNLIYWNMSINDLLYNISNMEKLLESK